MSVLATLQYLLSVQTMAYLSVLHCNFMAKIRFLLNINTLGNARYRVLTAVVINLVSWDAVFYRHATNISNQRSASVFRVQQQNAEWLPDPEATRTRRELFTSWRGVKLQTRKFQSGKCSHYVRVAACSLSVFPQGFSLWVPTLYHITNSVKLIISRQRVTKEYFKCVFPLFP